MIGAPTLGHHASLITVFIAAICSCWTLLARDADFPTVSANARAAWAEYKTACRALQGTFSGKTIDRSDDGILQSHNGELRQLGTSHTLQIFQQTGPQRTGGTAFGLNPAYSFALHRTAETEPWTIQTFIDFTNESPSAPDTDRVVSVPCAGIQVKGRWLADLFGDPTFTPISVEHFEEDGQPRVSIRFTIDQRVGQPVIRGGEITLDPIHFYVLRRCTLDCIWGDGPGKLEESFSYEIETGGFPRIVRVDGHQWTDAGIPESADIGTVRLFDLARAPTGSVEDFTLTDFGLPEPPRRGLWNLMSRRGFWALVLCLIAVMVVAFARRFASR